MAILIVVFRTSRASSPALHPRLARQGVQRGRGAADLTDWPADGAVVHVVAGMPLQLHLGHPERAYEIFFTPQPTSAMAMFGFVYLWYLLGILLVEIWFEYGTSWS